MTANDARTVFTATIPLENIVNENTLGFTLSDATDTYGNTYTNFRHTSTSRFALNRRPEIVSVTRAGPSQSITNLERIVWRVEFSEPVTGVDADDFIITLDTDPADVTSTDTIYEGNLIGRNATNQVYLLSLDALARTATGVIGASGLVDLEGVLTVTWEGTSIIQDASNLTLTDNLVTAEVQALWQTYTVDNSSETIATEAPILTIETAVTAVGTSASPAGVHFAPAVGQSLTATPASVGVNGTITITVSSNVPLMEAPTLNIAGFTTQPTLAVMTGTDDRVWTGTITISDSQPSSDGPLQITIEDYRSSAADPVSGAPVTVMTTLATMNPNERGRPVGAITIARDARIASITAMLRDADDATLPAERGFAEELVWRIVFSSGVRNVSAGDFCVTTSSNACANYEISSVSSSSPTTYTVRAMPANDAVAVGPLGLGLVTDHDIVSLSTNAKAVIASPTGAQFNEAYPISSTQATMGRRARPSGPPPSSAELFVVNRASQIMASLPDLESRLSSRIGRAWVSSGGYSASVDDVSSELDIDFYIPTLGDLEDNLWGNLTYTSGEYETSSSSSLILNIGIDKIVSPRTLLGAFFIYDSSSEDSLEGTGWLAGPYIATRLPNDLSFTSRVGFGSSTNDGTNTNGTTFDFETDRLLADAEISGRVAVSNDWDLLPAISYTYFSSSRSDGTSDQTLGKLEFGPKFMNPDSYLSPNFGLSGIWDFTDNGKSASTDELSMRLDGGITYQGPSGINLDVGGFYDGIGAKSEIYGLSLGLAINY